jgi:peptidyl-tRNA hydrolase
VGIGKPADDAEPVDYVLQNFKEEENKKLTQVLDNINNCIETIYKSDPEKAMNKFHTVKN